MLDDSDLRAIEQRVASLTLEALPQLIYRDIPALIVEVKALQTMGFVRQFLFQRSESDEREIPAGIGREDLPVGAALHEGGPDGGAELLGTLPASEPAGPDAAKADGIQCSERPEPSHNPREDGANQSGLVAGGGRKKVGRKRRRPGP